MGKSDAVPPDAGAVAGPVSPTGEGERVAHLRAARGVVLVTGTGSGMGLSALRELVREGFHVIATVLSEDETAGVLARVPAGSTSVLPLDITRPEQIDALAASVRQLLGRAGVAGLAGLVNNAGVGVSGPLEAVPVDRLRWQFEVNVFGQIALTQALLPLLRPVRGRIVNIGSVGAWITMPFGGPLTASKAAFRALNDALRMELKPSGVKVVLLEPARVRTGVQELLARELETTTAQMSKDNRALYAEGYRAMVTAALRHEEGGDPPEVTARAVVRALTDARPRSRRPIGRTAVVLGLFGRVLPNPVLDRVRYRLLDLRDYARGTR